MKQERPELLFYITSVVFLLNQAQFRELVPTIAKMVGDIPDFPALPHFLGVTSQKGIDLLRKASGLINEIVYYF
jgi:hypothetical protein